MHRFGLRSLQFVLDFALLETAFFILYWWRFQTGQFDNPVIFTSEEILLPSLLVSGFWHLHFSIFGMYRVDPLQSRAQVLSRCVQASAYGCLLIFILTFEPGNPLPKSRVVLLTYAIGVMFGTAATRLSILTILQELRIRGVGRLSALIVGSGVQLKSVLRFLELHKEIGARVDGLIGERNSELSQISYRGGYAALRAELERHSYDLVYIAVEERDERLLRRLVLLMSEFPVRQFIPANQYQLLLGSVKPLGNLGQPMIEIRSDLLTPIERALKRVFDIAFSLMILFLTAPLWLLTAVAIFADGGRPVFYSQSRVGRNGKLFQILKFRTMVPDAEAASGPTLAKPGDPRITKIGRFLRATRIDELPQLINVLLGQMSLVGPRPERPEFVSEFERRTPLYVRRLNVKPGLTGWAQVQLRYDATQVAPDLKLQMDMYYIENMSLPLDMKILFMTLFVVLRGEG